ncbi:MAG: hypothetical protein QG671_2102 [Actinomycetota bacterium]|jgi:hypothetical protein|nr:hypothetical protein [Actinomycetota bacterium]
MSLVAIGATWLGVGVLLASAASLGGILAASLYASSHIDVAKNASLSYNFVSANGNLNGKTLATGQVWVVHSGSWSIQANRGRQTNTGNLRTASLPWFRTPTVVGATITTTGPFNLGVYMQGNAAGTVATVLRVRNGTPNVVELGRISGGTFTVRASTTSATSAATWALSYKDGDCTVTRNGTSILTYTFPAIERAAIEANTRVGMITSGNVGNDRYTGFTASSF